MIRVSDSGKAAEKPRRDNDESTSFTFPERVVKKKTRGRRGSAQKARVLFLASRGHQKF